MKSDFLGGAIAIGAAFMSIFGVSLQKYSFDQEEKRTVQRPIFLRPLWWVGMLCVVGASLGDFLALGFAPQTLVASLGGGSTILGNMLLSRFWLKQALYYTDIIGACFVTMGVVTLACASVSEPGHYKMDKIYQLMQAAPFILYCFITTAFVMTLYLRVRRSKAPALRVAASSSTSSATTSASSTPSSTTTSVTEPQHPESVRLQPVPSRDTAATLPESETPDNSDTGSSTTTPKSGATATTNGQTKTHQRSALMSPFPSPIYGETLSLSPTRLAGEEDDVLDDDMMDHVELTKTSSFNRKHLDVEIEKHTLIIDPNLPLYWAAISGTIGAQSLLLAKCVVEMISSTINGDNQFVYFGTYVIVGAMVATLLSQTHTLNLAIELGDTMSAYPVFQAFWISMSNVSGIVFFQQTGEFTSTQWMLFPTAIVFVVVGMTLLAKHEKFGNRVKYSVAMPISLSSPRQHDIVAQSFVFRVLTPQRQLADDADDDFDAKSFGQSPRRRRASVDTAV